MTELTADDVRRKYRTIVDRDGLSVIPLIPGHKYSEEECEQFLSRYIDQEIKRRAEVLKVANDADNDRQYWADSGWNAALDAMMRSSS